MFRARRVGWPNSCTLATTCCTTIQQRCRRYCSVIGKEELLRVGDQAEIKKSFTEEDVTRFAGLSEDRNPIHLDAAYAEQTRFKQRIVHGMLTSSLFSAILGTKLPGRGSIYLSQSLSFKAPVYLGEEVTARVEVTNVHESKPIVTFATRCYNSLGTLCIDGEAVVYVPHHAGKR